MAARPGSYRQTPRTPPPVVATERPLGGAKAISRRRDIRAVAPTCRKEVALRRVLVLFLILGATVGVSPALAAQRKKPSTPNTAHPAHFVGRLPAIAIIAGR